MIQDIKKLLHNFDIVLNRFPSFKYAGDPILREKTKGVSIEEGVKLGKKLGKVLEEYRKVAGFGRGLAAPQIGENKSVFVTNVDDEIQIFINPKITKRSSNTNFYKELCLSAGIMAADVERSVWIIMEWMDSDGIKHKKKFTGFLARLYQHEEAHLRGLLNIDETASKGIEFMTFNPFDEKLRKKR